MELTAGPWGPYRLLAPIAKGGMGTVWAAQKGNKVYALKALHHPDDRLEQMFEQEAEVATRIQHPNVVRTYGKGSHSGVTYLVMELIRGEPLVGLFRSVKGPLPYGAAIYLLSQIARGLHAVHSLGYVHRDVSPQNVLLTIDGGVKLIDFGIAKVGAESDLTREGEIKGKIAYLAPEQLMGEAVDHRADIWAMGILGYQALLGRNPFRGATDTETIQNLCKGGSVTPPSALCASFPEDLEAILLKCLARDPDDRWGSVLELAEALEGLGTGTREELQKLVGERLGERLRSREVEFKVPEVKRWPKIGVMVVATVLALGLVGFATQAEEPVKAQPEIVKPKSTKVYRITRRPLPPWAPILKPQVEAFEPMKVVGQLKRPTKGPFDKPFAPPIK